MWDWVLKLNSRLSFLTPFTGGKKCLEFPDMVLLLNWIELMQQTPKFGGNNYSVTMLLPQTWNGRIDFLLLTIFPVENTIL